MSWFSELLAFNSKIATLLLRVDDVVAHAAKLDDKAHANAKDIAEIRGLLQGLPALALLDKLEDQSQKIIELETKILSLETLLQSSAFEAHPETDRSIAERSLARLLEEPKQVHSPMLTLPLTDAERENRLRALEKARTHRRNLKPKPAAKR